MDNYIKEIQKAFPIFGKEEKEYLKDFVSMLEFDSPKLEDYDDYVERYGTPEEIANQYFESTTPDTYKKQIDIKRQAMKVLIVLGLIFILFVVKESIQGKKSYIDREVIEIGVED